MTIKTMQLPEELINEARELSLDIHKMEELNKLSFKYLNLYRKEFKKLIKKEYPNLDYDQYLKVSYDSKTNEIFFEE
jgi:hypothetical protein